MGKAGRCNNNGEKRYRTYDGRICVHMYVPLLYIVLNSQYGAISVRRGKKKVLSVRLCDAVKVCSQMR